LDAIVALQNSDAKIGAVFVSLQDPPFDISAFFALVREEHPRVRRIAFAEHKGIAPMKSVWSCEHDMLLWDPWSEPDYLEILRDALDWRLSRGLASWPDIALFHSQHGRDVHAITQLLKRYHHRIEGLTMDRGYLAAADTEHVVQDTYSRITTDLPLFDHSCSPAHWIDQKAEASIASFENGQEYAAHQLDVRE
jgi:hypothetical protein